MGTMSPMRGGVQASPPRARAAATIAVLATLAATLASAPASAVLRLLPEPRHLTPGEGRLPLGEGVRIAVAGDDEEDGFAARLLSDEIRRACGVTPAIVKGGAGTIVLSRDPNARELGEEGYRLTVNARGARATAATAAGLYYAVQTLRQLVEPDGLDAVAIEDVPSLRWRGVHDDLSRGPLPTLETLERRIRTAAELKLNLYLLYFETSFAYRAHPLLAASGGTLDSSDVDQLVRFARRHHVELVPEQQTTGHMQTILRQEHYQPLAEFPHGSTIAPGPDADAFVGSMVSELAPLFPGPWIHLGGDEPGDLGQGRSRSRVESEGPDGLFLDHVSHLAAIARAHGKRAMIWGDAIVDHPEWASRFPRDVAITSWCYDSQKDYSRWINPFVAAQLQLFVCPGALNWNRVFPNLDIALPCIRDFVAQGRKAGVAGAITCVWADNGDAPFDLCWYALAGGAAAAWQEGALDTTRLHDAFDWWLLRSPGTELADAIARLQQIHRTVQSATRYDANLALYWQHPFGSPLDNQMSASLAPASGIVCQLAEDARLRIVRARERAAVNREMLDTYDFAAERMHAIGMRARVARDVAAGFRELQASAAARQSAEWKHSMERINAALVEGRETTLALRDEQERLWRRDNRPYWLGNLLALYDRDAQLWLAETDRFRECDLRVRLGRSLPAADELELMP